jgi:hypothetical protein
VRVDLHCHSSISDGVLPPAAVVARAAANGAELLALTDHDDVGGLAEAAAAADGRLRLVPGVEISVTWGTTTIHVVGLGIDAQAPQLLAGLAAVRGSREGRACRIGEALAAIGIPGALAGARRYAMNPQLVSRTHFARYLVEQGVAASVKGVFDHYLVRGRPGFVEHRWAALADALAWIRAAGGIAVLAHPGRYRVSGEDMRRLLTEFKDLGGGGIEVLSGAHGDAQVREFARLAREFDLAASSGSDFHAPGESTVDVGRMPDLPPGLVPVWQALS